MIQSQKKTTSEESSKNDLPLGTEEINSILSKTQNSKFLKSDNFFGETTANFKKFSLEEIAAKSVSENVNLENKKLSEEENSQNKKPYEDKKVLNEIDNNKEFEHEVKIPEKIYTKEQADKIAQDLAKEHYQKGFDNGVKNIKEELQKGEEVLALALKNTIDNLFHVSPDFLSKINKNINSVIKDICSKVIGEQIDTLPEKFLKKINSLVDSIQTSNDVRVILNEEDLNVVMKSLEKNKPQTNIKFESDVTLSRGDLILKSGGVEIEDVVSKKINLFHDSNIEKEISEIKEKNMEIKTEKVLKTSIKQNDKENEIKKTIQPEINEIKKINKNQEEQEDLELKSSESKEK